MRNLLCRIICTLIYIPFVAATCFGATDSAGNATIGTPVVVNTPSVDLGPLMQAVIVFLAAIVPSLGAYFAYLIKKKLNIQQDSADAAKIDAAAQRAGALALDFLKNAVPANASVNIRSTAVAAATTHVLSALPDTLKRLGVTPDTVGRMVNAELTKLEQQNPAAAPVPVPASTTKNVVSAPSDVETGGTIPAPGPSPVVVTTGTVAPTIPAVVSITP